MGLSKFKEGESLGALEIGRKKGERESERVSECVSERARERETARRSERASKKARERGKDVTSASHIKSGKMAQSTPI